jgi:D-beta-D-heptose 7-phosphate kinase / D-beta-D-heptose 1-phosphate adenosyltransferase
LYREKLCVYGDIMLDEWVYGDVGRISPEAPVPVILESYRSYNLGGSLNLSANLSVLGNDVETYGVLCRDNSGLKVLDLLDDFNICYHIEDHSITTTKTRLVDLSGHHIVRLDREVRYQGTDIHNRLLNDIRDGDILVISDYDKGVVNKELIVSSLKVTSRVFVDPKQSPDVYKGVYLIKPNIKQYNKWFGELNDDVFSIMESYGWEWLIITAGGDGIYIVNDGKIDHIREEVKSVSDVTGAGDIVLAVIVHCYMKGMSIKESCEIACYAASKSVESQGVNYVTESDLKRDIVFTNGVFDILHFGHLQLLKDARSRGSKLIVGINSDNSVKRLKGSSRPINNELTRQKQLEMLSYVDEVIIFDENTPYNLIKKLKPDLIVKGGDYTKNNVIGNDLAPVYIYPIIPEYSTTNIIKKCQDF